jgi:hypothetical protein
MPAELTKPEYYVPDDISDAHALSVEHLNNSINDNPTRLLDILKGMPAYPSSNEMKEEPLIELLLLATDRSTGIMFDEVTEDAIAEDPLMQAARAPSTQNLIRIKSHAQAEIRGDKIMSTQDTIQRLRLSGYIARVATFQENTESAEPISLDEVRQEHAKTSNSNSSVA